MLRMFKRFACLFVAAVLIASLAGCRKETAVPQESETITVYSTFYPLHAITELIAEDAEGVRTMCLVQPQDGCLRNYQLSDWDLAMMLRSADAVIAGGRGLESFENTLFALGENGPAVTALLYNLELNSTQAEGIADGEISHWEDNPHIYMSVDGAITLAQRISASMQEFDPECSEVYRENCADAEKELQALKEQMLDICGDVSGMKVALLNEALVYFDDNFELNTVLCYHRESGEDIDNKEKLLETIRMSEAEIVLIEKQAPLTLVKALEDAGLAVSKVDIMSTHTAADGYKGYFEAQMNNANELRIAIGASRANSED